MWLLQVIFCRPESQTRHLRQICDAEWKRCVEIWGRRCCSVCFEAKTKCKTYLEAALFSSKDFKRLSSTLLLQSAGSSWTQSGLVIVLCGRCSGYYRLLRLPAVSNCPLYNQRESCVHVLGKSHTSLHGCWTLPSQFLVTNPCCISMNRSLRVNCIHFGGHMIASVLFAEAEVLLASSHQVLQHRLGQFATLLDVV